MSLEHAQTWFNKIKSQCDLGLRELTEALSNGTPVVLAHSPVRVLREVQEDGTDIFLGDIGLFRCSDMRDFEKPKHDSATNRDLPPGHPDIVWCIGGTLISITLKDSATYSAF